MSTTVTAKGQVTIPKPVRDFLGIGPGSRVSFGRTEDGRVELRPEGGAPKRRSLADLRGHAGPGPSTEEIMALTRGEVTDGA